MATLVAARYNPRVKPLYSRLLARAEHPIYFPSDSTHLILPAGSGLIPPQFMVVLSFFESTAHWYLFLQQDLASSPRLFDVSFHRQADLFHS